ncbi:MAG TPA: hypothetical protein VEJ63_23710 [Planctomycetota bacterium]|nr:hypothetical protein [Planctomycetota bacterium]
MKVRAFSVCAMVLGGLVLLTGCEDKTARSSAAEAAQAAKKLEAQVSEAVSKHGELVKAIETIRTELDGKLQEKLDTAIREMDTRQKRYLEDVKSAADRALKEATGGTDRLRADYDASFAAAKTTMAADVQKLRDEIKVATDDLKKFMDNQLRELYPYAYQPRRLDPATPPAPETK